MITTSHCSNLLNQSKHKHTVSTLSSLIHHSLSSNSLPLAQSIHAHFLKLGLNNNTFLANSLLNLYSHLTLTNPSTLRFFQEIPTKNTFTYNIFLSALCKSGRIEDAHHLFVKMPTRDSVSWNSMISGYASMGLVEKAFASLYVMQESGFRPTGFTFSIAAGCVVSDPQAKQVHASALRNGFDLSDTVIANSFINMYGNVGLVGYACSVFRFMCSPDIVSWNTMISVFGDFGHGDMGFECLKEMMAKGLILDAFTVSTVISFCADWEDLGKGEQLLAYCFKMGYLSNSIVSSAVIDMYSKCGRLNVSTQLFREVERWDSAVCNSMASAYVQHCFVSEALRLFVDAVRIGIRPTEFTFASILSSNLCISLANHGTQIHCWVIKSGLEAERVIASALINMYTKLGSIESAKRIFYNMCEKDLVSWNTIIMGLAQNGQALVALEFFKQMLTEGLKPDQITFVGVLSACSYEGMICEGKNLFLSMEEKYGVARGLEHYVCMVDMMGRAGRLTEAMDVIESMPFKPNALVWEILLEACRVHGDLSFSEMVAEKVMTLETRFPLPYVVLSRMYGMRGKWEAVAQIKKIMSERGVMKVRGCSCIAIKHCIFVFKSNSILHCGGETTYSLLRSLGQHMEVEGYVPEQNAEFEDDREE